MIYASGDKITGNFFSQTLNNAILSEKGTLFVTVAHAINKIYAIISDQNQGAVLLRREELNHWSIKNTLFYQLSDSTNYINLFILGKCFCQDEVLLLK